MDTTSPIAVLNDIVVPNVVNGTLASPFISVPVLNNLPDPIVQFTVSFVNSTSGIFYFLLFSFYLLITLFRNVCCYPNQLPNHSKWSNTTNQFWIVFLLWFSHWLWSQQLFQFYSLFLISFFFFFYWVYPSQKYLFIINTVDINKIHSSFLLHACHSLSLTCSPSLTLITYEFIPTFVFLFYFIYSHFRLYIFLK